MSETYEFIRVEEQGSVATITFDRPEVRNALHLPMNLEIRAALRALTERGEAQVVIFTGAGDRAFVSGADIAELRERKGPVALARHNAELCDAIEACKLPTLAAINGFALGGGCEVALACDIRVAAENAKLGQPEVSLGIIPAAGGSIRLQRLLGPGIARELIFTGRVIDAQEAARVGLVNRVVPQGQLMETALEIAQEIVKNSANAVQLSKLVMNEGRSMGPEVGVQLEALAQAVCYNDPEKYDRMGAFLDKREARRKAREGGQ
jgi:enoyl-CoA hydratase/carnithine racemase